MKKSSIQNKPEEIDYKALPSSSPLWYQLIAGALARIMEHSVMFPIDALKTKIQSVHTKSISEKLVTQIIRISYAEGALAL